MYYKICRSNNTTKEEKKNNSFLFVFGSHGFYAAIVLNAFPCIVETTLNFESILF